ncbi:MAG: cytidine deaminase [Phycisphaerae bacterium]|nr:cytidine deaminase [Phycisphaerae bacterium]
MNLLKTILSGENRILSRVIRGRNLNLGDLEKNKRFNKSIHELVTIMFAVVLGLGLQELDHIDKETPCIDFGFLFVAYIAVILSWWFYHKGTIAGPAESNVLSYSIDCLLIVFYWLMMHWRGHLCWLLFFYTCMFLLYFLWELVRVYQPSDQIEREKVKHACTINLVFVVLSGLITAACWLLKRFPESDKYVCLAAVAILVVSYRIPISIIYSRRAHIDDGLWKGQQEMNSGSPTDMDRHLAERAKMVSAKARAHLSGFRVGAAVLSESGNIYVGCNIEFDNYSNTIHAEEAAISALIVAGDSKPVKIAVFTHTEEPCFPCGMCRQSLFELGGKDLVVLACTETRIEQALLAELIPSAFHL